MSYYRRNSRSARKGYRVGSVRRSSGRRVVGRSRSRRGTSAGARTVRIVIEQPATNPLARPELAGLTEAASRKARF